MLRVKLLGGEELKRRLEHVATQARPQIEKALLRAGKLVEGEAKQTIYAGHPSHLAGDSGALRASLTTQPLGPGRVAVGTASVYGRIHEFGGVIKPKTKPWLVFFIPSAEGRANTSLSRRQTRGGVWVRTKQVKIPARPYLGPALEHQQPAIRRKLEQAVEALLRGK